MQALNTGIHTLAHSGVSVGLGTVLEKVMPAYDEGKPSFILLIEAGAQLTLSAVIVGELLRLLSPSSASYISPIGDGFATYFLMDSQPNLRAKLYRGVQLATGFNYMDRGQGTKGATSNFQS